MLHRSFFSSYEVYRQWAKHPSGVFPCHEAQAQDTDPLDECFPDLEGPYYLSPEYLALRVAGTYCVLSRVATEEEAAFTWYDQEAGERVYAAYVWDEQLVPPTRLEAETLPHVRQKLASYLKANTSHRSVTRWFRGRRST